MQKLNSITYMRAFCMVYIVAYWHMFDYTDAFPLYRNLITERVTVVVLGLFVFISGYLSGRSSLKTGPLSFYKKKLLRIYPLYLIAVILFYFCGLNSAKSSLLSLIGLSVYSPPFPTTLWFVVMLFTFYLSAPFLSRLIVAPRKYFKAVVLVACLISIFYVLLKPIDLRVVTYLPCFMAGIYCSIYGFKGRLLNFENMLILSLLGLPIAFAHTYHSDSGRISHIPLSLSLSIVIFSYFRNSEEQLKKSKIVELISYSSFAMYLFHRPAYVFVNSIYFPKNEQLQVLYLIAVCIIFIFPVCWLIQRSYDFLRAYMEYKQ